MGLKQQAATQNKQIETLSNEPPNKSAEIIQQQIQEHTNNLNTQQFWQRELDRSANQLVVKNLKKTPNTMSMHPREIFISNILSPMGLNTEDLKDMDVFCTFKIKIDSQTKNK